MSIISNKIKILPSDNQVLSAILLSPKDIAPKAVLQFHAGTVIRKEFHLKLCTYLAEQGFVVVLFDYRGVGESKPRNLKGFEASISDWGRKDAPAVLDWIKKEYPDLPIHLLAHSMGGQILGLMPNWNLFDKIMVLASSSGNWNNFEPSYQRKVKWSSYLLFPILLSLFGYVTGRFGLGQDWPKGVAEEWRKNCQQNTLMAHFMQSKFSDTYYHLIDKKITAYFFLDDQMATAKTIPNFQKSYPNASVETFVIRASDFGLESIGHFGLFKEKTKGKLWEDIRDYFC